MPEKKGNDAYKLPVYRANHISYPEKALHSGLVGPHFFNYSPLALTPVPAVCPMARPMAHGARYLSLYLYMTDYI